MFVPKPETPGIDDQTARLNARPPQGDEIEDTRSAGEKYAEWGSRTKARLGIQDLRGDVPADNATLVAALAKIATSGAPDPIIVKNIVAYPPDPTKSFENELYVFTHFQNPRLSISAGEAWLALNPDVLIEELRVAGIRAK